MSERPAEIVYLDNAATSWPKPPSVSEAMMRFLRDVGASPGRSGHRLANNAERIRLSAREAVARLFGLSDPLRVVFTCNATVALNVVLHGLLTPGRPTRGPACAADVAAGRSAATSGSHVVTTGLEHNAVMRPLRALEARGVSICIAPCRPDGTLEPGQVADRLGPNTRLIVVNHASNVCGTVLPVREIGALARQHNIPLLVDAAQTGGCWPIDLQADNIDLLAFTGHKGLLGPTGTGGLAIHEDFDISRLPPLVQGGTGSRSEHETQPDFLPDRYEAGTPNSVGLAGLAAGVEYVLARGVESIRLHEQSLTQRLIDGLRAIPGVHVIGPGDASRQTAVVSFTLAGRSPSDVALALDEQFGIMCRPGLHCAPLAHRTLGTLPAGTVRLAPGPFSTDQDVDRAIAAVARLARSWNWGSTR